MSIDTEAASTQAESMKVNLSANSERFVRRKVDEGQFGSPEDVVSEGLRLLESREQWAKDAREKIEAGWQQIQAGDVFSKEEVLRNLNRRKAEWKANRGR